ncbi:uncharacterized protein LOC134778883 [Penaeus indicus]|uniref:uncharacterized protein LOC134778883 n=1 Tax=Penaeus indicus TaxID=29960 RepID=UPI00300D74EB
MPVPLFGHIPANCPLRSKDLLQRHSPLTVPPTTTATATRGLLTPLLKLKLATATGYITPCITTPSNTLPTLTATTRDLPSQKLILVSAMATTTIAELTMVTICRRSVKVFRGKRYIRSRTHCRSHIALFRLTNPAEMKYLVFVLLVAAACASEVEKREAEPSRALSYGYGVHHHAYPRTYYHPYHRFHKRSAEPEADAEPSYLGYYRPYSYSYHNTPYVHHHYKRSAEPEAEAEPSYGSSNYYRPYSYGYQPHHYIPSVHHHHKRSADPVAEADASYGYRSYHPVYYHSYQHTPYTHSHYKRSAEPEADPSYGHHHQTVYRPYHSGAHYGYSYRAHHH